MVLKVVIDKAEDVPEALKAEYVEKDGKWYLDLDGTLGQHTSVLALSNSLANAKKEKQTLQAKLTALEAKTTGLPDDFDPARYADVVAELEALKTDPNRDKDTEQKLQRERDRYEQRLRDAEKAKNDAVKAKDDEIRARESVISELLVDDGLTAAMVKHGVAKEFLPAAKALLKGAAKVEKTEEGKYEAVVETDLGKVNLDRYVENWSKSDDGKPFIVKATGSGANGSGQQGRTENNPWAKDSINRTEQGRLVRDEPAKAERLMKAAGIPAAQVRATLNREAA